VEAEYGEHLTSSSSLLTQVRFCAFTVVSLTAAFVLRLHPDAVSSDERYFVFNFFLANTPVGLKVYLFSK